MKSNWESYQGKRVFMARYDHLNCEDLRAEVSAVEKEILQQPPKSVLALIDTTGTIGSPEALNIFKNVAQHTGPFTRKTAVLGISGARRTLLDIVGKFSGLQLETFENVQQAKDWLVKA